MKLVLVCIECGIVAHAPFTGERLHSRELYRATGWVLSLVDPAQALMAPLCPPCAEKFYPPELLAVVKAKFSGDSN